MSQALHPEPAPPVSAIVLMGVCGCGKTEIGRRLACTLGWTFHDGDDFHPPANVEKMRSGRPLDDDDRGPWLDALARLLRESVAAGRGVVVGCSALARRYRARLGLPDPRIMLVHLDGTADTIRKRLEQRAGHCMPTTLLDSQFATLERPTPAEGAVVVDVGVEPDAIVRQISAAVTPR